MVEAKRAGPAGRRTAGRESGSPRNDDVDSTSTGSSAPPLYARPCRRALFDKSHAWARRPTRHHVGGRNRFCRRSFYHYKGRSRASGTARSCGGDPCISASPVQFVCSRQASSPLPRLALPGLAGAGLATVGSVAEESSDYQTASLRFSESTPGRASGYRMRDGHRRAYVTTPQRCPGRGSWVSKVRFAYHDGTTQTEGTRNPCDI